jgi:predicted transposase YbfD/YdcC
MLESFLFKVKDHRRKQGRRYVLGHVLLLAIFAILSGADSYRKIHAFIATHYEVLKELLALNWKRLPAYTTIRHIIQAVSAADLEESFRQYSANLTTDETRPRFMAFDGKVLRGSFDNFQDQKAIQILSAFMTESDIILAHETIAKKTNEIPVVQALIAQLGLAGYIFTLDALHCQTKTLQVAKETGNEVIVQVKANQATLLRDCITTSETNDSVDVYQEPVMKTHNRIERRTVEVFAPTPLSESAKWDLVEAIIRVDRQRQIFDTKTKAWKQTDEVSFYISTTVLSAEAFGQGIRQHWGIENRDHYVRDVSLGEDRSRIRINADIFARLRSFALNILRKNNVSNVGLTLFNNGMNLNNVLNYAGVRQN